MGKMNKEAGRFNPIGVTGELECPFTYDFFPIQKLFIYYFWLHWVFTAAHGLSLVAASRGWSLVAMHGLLTAVASLIAEHGF